MFDLAGILNQVTENVMENMFFSAVMGELAAPGEGRRVCATVRFHGSSSGQLGVSAAHSTAVTLAAGFLGSEDEAIEEAQVRAVVGELANVLCGVVLGRMNPAGQFAISPPDVTDNEDAAVIGMLDLRRRFELVEGDLSVGLTVRQAA